MAESTPTPPPGFVLQDDTPPPPPGFVMEGEEPVQPSAPAKKQTGSFLPGWSEFTSRAGKAFTDYGGPEALGFAAGEAAMPLGGGIPGAMIGTGIRQILKGKPDPGEAALTGATTGAASRLGDLVQWIRKVPGKFLSLPAERMAAGAEMMEKVPERFGVSNDSVDAAYTKARNLSKTIPESPTPKASASAAAPKPKNIVDPTAVEDAISRLTGRGFNHIRAGEKVLGEFVQKGYALEDVLPAVNKGIARTIGRQGETIAADKAAQIVANLPKAAPLPPTPTLLNVRPPEVNASLENFGSRIDEIVSHIKGNPIKSLQDKPMLKALNQAATEVKGLKAGGVSPEQIDRIIKSVNTRISQATDASTEGVWKHLLAGLHEDLTAAATKTKDPAFQAFADAIQESRLNFLRRDLEKVITSANPYQRTGKSVISKPGPVLNWMAKHPEWEQAVEKAKPGLLDSIKADIQEIIPITDTTGRSIPGQSWGSGRHALGASAAVLIGKALGVSPVEAAAFGSILAGGTQALEATGGLRMSPDYIRRSFQPTVSRGVSTIGGQMGAPLGKLASDVLRGDNAGQP